MKKLFSIFMLMFLALTVVGCKKEIDIDIEPPIYDGISKVVFREKLDGDAVQPYKAMSVTRHTATPVSTKGTNGWIIGDRPEIYFEYERGEQFSFVEAQIERSSNPGVVFKFKDSVENLDGYKIQSGQSYNSITGTDHFRAIITVPEINDFGIEEYILVSIKIEVDGVKMDIEIPEENRDVEISVTQEALWDQIASLATRPSIWNFNKSEFFYLYDRFPVSDRLTFKILLDGEVLEEVGADNQGFITLPGIGDAVYNFSVEITLGEESRTYEYLYKHTSVWSDQHVYPTHRLILSKINEKELTIQIGDTLDYNGEDIIVHRNVSGSPINKIEIADNVSIEDGTSVNIRLFGYENETDIDLITLFGDDLQPNVNIFFGNSETPIVR